ncbi:MAG: BatD family protein [Verrucomicrobia bacterium]|nr:BatD family protein [Verrucomicrobiota bacterium]
MIIRGGVIQSGTNAAPIDPLINLMMSQPQVETNQVFVVAEFDPPAVPAGARATYRLIVTALSETIVLPEKLPAPAGLRIEEGGKAQALQNLGSIIQARSTYNFRAYPAAPGGVVMPAFAIKVAGKSVTVPEARLTVLAPSAVLVPAPARLSLEIPTNDIYIGQAVAARLLISDPGDNSVLAMTQAHVVGDGLLAEGGFARMMRQAVMRDGRPQLSIMSEVLATPMREGKLTVFGQASVILNRGTDVRYPTMPGYYPLMDTEPVTMHVRRVPDEGARAGFTGAIGNFQLDPPQLSLKEVRAGDPVLMQVVVRGEGNFGRFTPPRPPADPDWQIFPPSTEANSGNQMQHQGYAAFVYTLIPLSDRVRATPAMAFSAFDPEKKKHVDLTIPPVALKVTPAPGGVRAPRAADAADAVDADANEPTLALAGLMENRGATVASLVPLQQRGGFLAAQLVPAALLGGLWWRDRRRRFHAAHPEFLLKRRARRALARQRRRARRAVATSDAGAFVTAAVNALRAAAAPHTAANPDALVCRDVLRELPAGSNGADSGLVRKIFSAADAANFTQRIENESALLTLGADFERVAGKLEGRL